MNLQFPREVAQNEVENCELVRITGQMREFEGVRVEHTLRYRYFVVKLNRGRNNDPLLRGKFTEKILREKNAHALVAVIELGKRVVVGVETLHLLEPRDVVEQRAEGSEKAVVRVERTALFDKFRKPDHFEGVIQLALHGVDKRTVRRAEGVHVGVETVHIIGKGHFAYSTERVSRMIVTLI